VDKLISGQNFYKKFWGFPPKYYLIIVTFSFIINRLAECPEKVAQAYPTPTSKEFNKFTHRTYILPNLFPVIFLSQNYFDIR
jgi:hypothetical protein